MAERRVGNILVLEPEEPTRTDILFERIAGALLGGAIADALGWPTEFARRPEDLAKFNLRYPLTDFAACHKRTGGRFLTRIDNIQPGDYSDDTQLALAVARSIGPQGRVDNEYFAKKELRYWLGYARGAGATVTAAAKAAARSRTDWRWNDFRFKRSQHDLDYRGAGANGAAMRVAPIALANVLDARQMYVETWKNAVVTHGHPRAVLGAVVFAESVRRLAHGHSLTSVAFIESLRTDLRGMDPPVDDPDVRYWLEHWNAGGRSFDRSWRECVSEIDGMLSRVLEMQDQPLPNVYRVLGCFDAATKGSGTASVAAALALFLRSGDAFERLAITGANMLGSDTDTIGAMAASMSGAWLGYVGIPERWAAIMADYSYLNGVAEYLTLVSLRQARQNEIRPVFERPTPPQMDLLAAMGRQDIVERRPYWHPLLGIGRVTKVESQEVGLKRPQGRVVMATVQFEFGQTCKFSSFTSLRPKGSGPRGSGRRVKLPEMRLGL
jgi:ADP-ribosylglycohydrolase